MPSLASRGRGATGRKVPDMHGMLSAGVLVAGFAAIAVAGLYVAARLFAAGARRRRTGQ